jgi:hypothetical protein
MPDVTRDWMAAAACTEGPRPEVTFADLPQQHQSEVVRLALVAAATVAYFVTAVTLAPPLSSRSLAAPAPLPVPARSRPVAPEGRTIDSSPAPRPLRKPTVQSRDGAQAVDSRDAPPDASAARLTASRRNIFSRFFRGLLRGVAPAA